MLFKFLWKGVDKVTRLSAINEYENGGLRMIDFETMVKSLRLTWLKRILVKLMVHGRVTFVKFWNSMVFFSHFTVIMM